MRAASRRFKCLDCQHEWDEPFGTGRPAACPKCGSTNIWRMDAMKGSGQRGFGGQGRGQGGRGGGRRR